MKESENKPMQVVLLGNPGSGKSTLYNRVTNDTQATGYGGQSITMDVFSKYAAYGNAPFKVLDTPGFGVLTNKIQHYAGIIAALTEAPVTRILLVVKLDRIDNMWNSVLPILAPLHRFRYLITVIITHMDLSKNHDSDLQLIGQYFEKKNINSIIYTQKNEDPSLTCEKIITESKKSQPEQIKFMESEIIGQFDLIELDGGLELEIQLLKGEITRMFRNKTKDLQKFVADFKQPDPQQRQKIYRNWMQQEATLLETNFYFFSNRMPEISKYEFNYCDVLHQVTIEVKKIAQQCIEDMKQQIKEIEEKSGENLYYHFTIILKRELLPKIKEIQVKVQEKIKEVKGHCFNNIKKCNHCGQIWMKSVGCEGRTYCGAKPEKDQKRLNYHFTSHEQFQKEMQKNGFAFQQQTNRNQNVNQVELQTHSNTSTNIKENNINQNIGCGLEIEWNQMHELSRGELTELFDQDLVDFFCKNEQEPIEYENNNTFQFLQHEIQNQLTRMRGS